MSAELVAFYAPTSSALVSTDVQGAIEELEAMLGSVGSSFDMRDAWLLG